MPPLLIDQRIPTAVGIRLTAGRQHPGDRCVAIQEAEGKGGVAVLVESLVGQDAAGSEHGVAVHADQRVCVTPLRRGIAGHAVCRSARGHRARGGSGRQRAAGRAAADRQLNTGGELQAETDQVLLARIDQDHRTGHVPQPPEVRIVQTTRVGHDEGVGRRRRGDARHAGHGDAASPQQFRDRSAALGGRGPRVERVSPSRRGDHDRGDGERHENTEGDPGDDAAATDSPSRTPRVGGERLGRHAGTALRFRTAWSRSRIRS